MGQFGMQMPASRGRRAGSLDVFAMLAFLAVVFLGAACVIVYQAATKLSPDGSAFSLQAVPDGKASTSMKFAAEK